LIHRFFVFEWKNGFSYVLGSKIARISIHDDSASKIPNNISSITIDPPEPETETSDQVAPTLETSKSNFFVSPRWEQFSRQVPPSSSCSTIASNSLEKKGTSTGTLNRGAKMVAVNLSDKFVDEKVASLSRNLNQTKHDSSQNDESGSEKFILAPVPSIYYFDHLLLYKQ